MFAMCDTFYTTVPPCRPALTLSSRSPSHLGSEVQETKLLSITFHVSGNSLCSNGLMEDLTATTQMYGKNIESSDFW